MIAETQKPRKRIRTVSEASAGTSLEALDDKITKVVSEVSEIRGTIDDLKNMLCPVYGSKEEDYGIYSPYLAKLIGAPPLTKPDTSLLDDELKIKKEQLRSDEDTLKICTERKIQITTEMNHIAQVIVRDEDFINKCSSDSQASFEKESLESRKRYQTQLQIELPALEGKITELENNIQKTRVEIGEIEKSIQEMINSKKEENKDNATLLADAQGLLTCTSTCMNSLLIGKEHGLSKLRKKQRIFTALPHPLPYTFEYRPYLPYPVPYQRTDSATDGQWTEGPLFDVQGSPGNKQRVQSTVQYPYNLGYKTFFPMPFPQTKIPPATPSESGSDSVSEANSNTSQATDTEPGELVIVLKLCEIVLLFGTL